MLWRRIFSIRKKAKNYGWWDNHAELWSVSRTNRSDIDIVNGFAQHEHIDTGNEPKWRIVGDDIKIKNKWKIQ